jgi:hypothetical protein
VIEPLYEQIETGIDRDAEKPLYERIAIRIESIAETIYRPWLTAPDGSRKEEELFRAWYDVRTIAGRIRCTKSVYLIPENWTQLYGGISLAHDLAHNGDMGGAPVKCGCSVSRWAEEVFELMKQYNRQLRGGNNAAA